MLTDGERRKRHKVSSQRWRQKNKDYCKRWREEHKDAYREIQKRSRLKNKDKRKEYNQLYRQTHKEQAKLWEENHKEQRREAQKRYREKHGDELRQKKKEASRIWRQKHPELSRQTARKYAETHRREKQEYANNYRIAMKQKVLTYYGGGKLACSMCGESRIDCLSIDHINAGGHRHLKEIKASSGSHFYYWLIKNGFPTGYQTLCMNCQFIKRIKNREN